MLAEIAARTKAKGAERTRLDQERRRLVDAIARGRVASVSDRIVEIESEIAALDAGLLVAEAEAARIRDAVIDDGELRALLGDFDALWGALWQAERERILRLLIDVVRFDGRTGTVEIQFAGGGDG
jgi:hypothetical protein